MKVEFSGLSLFPNIKLAHLELTFTCAPRAQCKTCENSKIFLFKEANCFTLTTRHTGDVPAEEFPFHHEYTQHFTITLTSQLLHGKFHRLGHIKNIHHSKSVVTLVFDLQDFSLAFPNESEYMVFDPIARYFFCKWCSVLISSHPLTIKEMPSDGWRNLVEYWTCHSNTQSDATISADLALSAKQGVVLSSRFYYSFFEPDVTSACRHLIENNKLSKLDVVPALSPNFPQHTAFDHKTSMDFVLSSILMSIIFYESIYCFKVACDVGHITFQVLNCNMFKIASNCNGDLPLSYLEVITIELKEDLEVSPKACINVSIEAFQSISSICAARNYLIKQTANF